MGEAASITGSASDGDCVSRYETKSHRGIRNTTSCSFGSDCSSIRRAKNPVAKPLQMSKQRNVRQSPAIHDAVRSCPASIGIAGGHFHDLMMDQTFGTIDGITLTDRFELNRQILA